MSGYQCVALGTSLGGLQAMRQLLAAMPGRLALPVCLVQHRRADAESLLPGLLQPHTQLAVLEPDDGTPLEPGRLYVAPGDYHLIVERDRLRLSVEAPVCFARPSIDVLFESAALSFEARAIVVALTGSNEDGVQGARRVSAAGGLVLVQDPAEAEAPELPRAVLGGVPTARALSLDKLGSLLWQLGAPVRGAGAV